MKRQNYEQFVSLQVLLSCVLLATSARFAPAQEIRTLQTAIEHAGDNAAVIREALAEVPRDEREGLEFLVTNMPQRDLMTLDANFLIENVREAYRARNDAPWKDKISKELFFNDVLPYAVLTEPRDPWRREFRERFCPLVHDAKTPKEAAVILNQKIFPLLKVRYSTERRRAVQSPKESIESGLASCTGLSILLIDACRAVGVPARFVGIPMWPDKSGNHSWVEIWDDGWHFTGAAEPSGNRVDEAWFAGRAATAQRDVPEHAIYAVSFGQTPLRLPRSWLTGDTLYGINVTDRYTKSAKPAVVAPMAETTDAVKPGDIRPAFEQLKSYLSLPPEKRPPLAEQPFASRPLTSAEAKFAVDELVDDHRAQIRRERAQEMDDRVIKIGDHVMPFYYKIFGDKPAGGRSLYISMHGGGNAAARVNDSQWDNQKRLYQLTEGVYLAPRAPTNTWNLWHEAHIDPMFTRLIEDLIVFEDVDPNRVYIMGYSAGGDGVYQLAPRMADQLAAAAMMAGHPNNASPLGLRNIGFTIHVGALDAAYNRNQVAADWKEKLDTLREADPQGYAHLVKIHEGKSHWMDREDAEALDWMAKFTRNPLPDVVVWKQSEVTHRRFYWLAVDADNAIAGAEVHARRDGQTIDIDASGVKRLIVRFNDQMLDMDQPVTIRSGDHVLFKGTVPRTIAVIAQTLAERGDPQAIYLGEVAVELAQ